MKSKEMPHIEIITNKENEPPVPQPSSEHSLHTGSNNNIEGINRFLTVGINHTSDDFEEIDIPYQQLIQALPGAIYTCDANGYILTYNQAAAVLWGREPAIGKDAWCGMRNKSSSYFKD
jgi:PAS domain-containing protein